MRPILKPGLLKVLLITRGSFSTYHPDNNKTFRQDEASCMLPDAANAVVQGMARGLAGRKIGEQVTREESAV